MKIAVRYFSRTGNTEKLAGAIASAVGEKAEKVSADLTQRADILFLGSSVYAADTDENVKSFIRRNKDKIGLLVNFSTAAIAKSTYSRIKKTADENGVAMAEEEFFCRGSFAFLHKGRPNDKDLQNAANFAKTVAKKIFGGVK